MTVTVNGFPHDVGDGETVADVVERLGIGPRGVAVARNGEVVPRSRWGSTVLEDADLVEVLTAAQGG